MFCFDSREFCAQDSGADNSGPYRAQFILESVADLRQQLREFGSELIVRCGRVEDVLVELTDRLKASRLFYHEEVTAQVGTPQLAYPPMECTLIFTCPSLESFFLGGGGGGGGQDKEAEQAVLNGIRSNGVEAIKCWGSTLLHIDDLPFKINSMPALYKSFRAKVEDLPVREPFEEGTDIRPAPYMTVDAGDIPTLQTLGFVRPLNSDIPNESKVTGGETHVLQKLNQLTSSSTVKAKSKALAGAIYKSVDHCVYMPNVVLCRKDKKPSIRDHFAFKCLPG